MNIAVIIERFDPDSGGAERSTAELVGEMQSRGHHITVLTGKGPPSHPSPSWLTIRCCPLGLPKGSIRLRYFRRWVQRQLATSEFDSSLSVTSTVPAALVEPRAGLIVDIQTRSRAWPQSSLARLVRRVSHAVTPRYHALLALERQTFRDPAVQHIVCISTMIRRQALLHYPATAPKLVHIPNAVKPIHAPPEQFAEWRTRLRGEWGISGDTTAFFFPALDSRRKGLTPLLHAFARLREQHPAIRMLLVIAGRVHASHQQLIHRLNLSSYVRDVRFQKDLRPYYAAIDVTTVPTYYDTFARVSIESLSLGRPAITTLFDGAAEMVDPNAAGGGGGDEKAQQGIRHGRVIADPDDHAVLALAMYELCDPAERQRCMQGVEALSQTYTTRHHVDKLLALMSARK